jgi:hypothetical protein
VSTVTGTKAYVFHTDLGTVVTQIHEVANYDVEDIVRGRAISLGRALQFLNQAKRVSPNDPKGPRTLESRYTKIKVELPD